MVNKINKLLVVAPHTKLVRQIQKVDVYVIPTNEELMIAQNVVELYLN